MSVLVFHFVQQDICHDLMYYLMRLALTSVLDLPLPLKGINLN